MKKYFLLIFAILFICSCHKGNDTQPDKVKVTGIAVNISELTITEGMTDVIEATVFPYDATNKLVHWSSTNGNVARVADGVITAIKEGSVQIKAISDDGGYEAACNVTVVKGGEIPHPVTGISLNQTALSLTVGESAQLAATIIPEDATNKGVLWFIDNASVASVNQMGVITALTAGTAVVTVCSKENTSIKASCSVDVKKGETPVVKVTGIKLSETELSLTVGESAQLAATIIPENATNKEIAWSVDNTSVVSISQAGTVSAVGAGTATITVCSKESPSIKALCSVSVKKAEDPVVKVTGIKLNATELSLSVGTSTTLNVTVLPENAANKDVEWSVDNPSIVNVGEDGKITAVAAGTAVVKVTSRENAQIHASCTVNVVNGNIPVEYVSFDIKNDFRLEVNEEKVVTVSVVPANATVKKYEFSTPLGGGLLIIKQDGSNQCTIRGSKAFNTAMPLIVEVTDADGNITGNTVSVLVYENAVTGIELDNKQISLNKGASKQLKATIKPDNASEKRVTWESDNTAVATVSDGVVKAVGVGTCRIKVAPLNNYKISAYCDVIVRSDTSSDGETEGVGFEPLN